MIPALALAVLVAPNPAAQTVKTIDIDRYNTPYSVTVSDAHNWYDLTKGQCLFPNRGSNFQRLGDPNNPILTFSIGNGHQKFTSPSQAAWNFSMDYYFDPGSIDLSAVDLFMVDFQTVPSGRLPDIPRLSAFDTSFVGGTVSWHIRGGGIYFRKSEFPNAIDWKHIRALSLRQDFSAFPNPTTYDVTRFYVTLKPVAVPPAP